METYCTCGKSGASIYCNGNCNREMITTDSTDAAPPAEGVEEVARGRYPLYSEQLDLPKHFDADDIAEAEQRAFKAGALWQSRQVGGGKSLEECHAYIAGRFGYPHWRSLLTRATHEVREDAINQAAELYASQNPQTQEGWVSVKDLPEIGHSVEVITEFNRNGQPASDRFIGFLNEEGDLVSLPEDDNYGWLFSECVTCWRYLSPPPPTTKQKQ